MDLSPFTQTPKLPGGPVAAAPLAWLCGLAVALGVAGLLGLRRRDVGDLGPSYRGGRLHDWLIDYLQVSQNRSRLPRRLDEGQGSLIQTDRWAGSSAACTAFASSSRTVPRSTDSCSRAVNAVTIWSAL